MKLLSYDTPAGPRAGVLQNDRVLDVQALLGESRPLRDVQALLEAVENGKQVAVFTNDVTPESVARIGEGKIIAETTHGFADWGWFGTEFAVRLACGLA